MRHHWRGNAVLCVLMVLAASSVPHWSWAKGERPAHIARPENGVMRGIVKAATQAMLYTQIQGRVSALPHKEGERIEKGDTLVRIDCEKYRAELEAAIAEHQAKYKMFANNKELAKLNAVSTLDLEISEAEARKAQATIRIADLNVRHCRVAAPFSGRITGVMVNEHENVFPNDKLLSLLDDTSLEIELVLPSSALAWLKRKSRFTFTIDETKGEYQGKVKEIGANIDPASQTVKVIGVFEKLPPDVLAGMSGSAQFSSQLPPLQP